MVFHPRPDVRLSRPSSSLQDDLSSDDGSCADFGRNSDSDEDAAGIRSDGGVGERDPLDRRETLLCDRLRVVMNGLTVLLASKMPGRSVEKLVSSATRVFRTITKVWVWLVVSLLGSSVLLRTSV